MSTAVAQRSSRENSTPIRSSATFARTPERHFLHPKYERPISPEYFKREKSPFELGDSIDLQVFSSNAIIDKASVMDISNVDVKNVDEYIQLFLTEYCVIDRAGIEDISEPSVRIMVVEEDEDTEKKRTGMMFTAPKPMPIEEPIIEETTAEVQATVIESEQKQEESVPSSENVGQDQQEPSSDENKSTEGGEIKTDDASSTEKPAENIEKIEKPNEVANQVEMKTEAEVKAEDDQKPVEPETEAEGSDTFEDFDSDFDNIEEVDPSYEIDPTLWKTFESFDEVDLKPPKPEPKEGEEPKEEPKKKKKEEEAEVEEDSGFSELVVVRSEKERDQEFQEYIRELCRPQIISFLPDRVAAKGTTVRLTCTVKGNNIQTRWTKDDVLIERGKKVQIKTDGDIHTLEIPDITERDAGVYTAFFKNRAGEVETSSKIRVFDGKLHKPDHIDIALVKDYYDHSLGGLVIEAHVHGLPTPNVKFYKDNHLLHARRNKVVFFVEDKEIFQLLMVRPDSQTATGTYTILAENAAGKRRFDHHVDFETKYPLIHLPGMYHADKKLDDFVDTMLSKIPKAPEEKAQQEQAQQEQAQQEKKEEVLKVDESQKVEETKPEPPKPEEIVEALESVVQEAAQQEAPKKKSKSKSKHRKHRKRDETPKIDADLINDGEDDTENEGPIVEEPYKRKFSTVVHEPYETEEFRIFNNSQKLWFSGNLRDQTVIEGSTVTMICTVSGPMPIVKWTKNEKPISWGQTIRNMSGEGIGKVIFDKITRADAGTYVCSARNSFNEVTTSATIKVIPKSIVPTNDSSKPLFTRVLGQFYHITEDDLILDAHVRGVPEPKIKWYKDGVELSKAMDDRYDICVDHDGGYQFRIHKPVAADSGLYACEAINAEGKAKVSHKVEFQPRDKHTHPQFVYHKESFRQPSLRMSIEPEPAQPQQDTMPEVEQAAAQSGNNSVNVQSSQGSSGASDGQDGSQNKDGSTPSQNGGSSGGDGNEDGDDNKDIPKSTSDVPEDEEKEEEEEEKKPQRSAPRPRRRRYEGPVEPLLIRDSKEKLSFAVQLRDITSPAGSNLRLCCQINGPGPQIKWFKNGKPLDQSPELRITGKDGFGIVTIAKAKPKDSGVYRIVASNKFNVIENEANVTVYPIEEVAVKPTFTRITDYYRQEVDDLIIEIQVRGVPTPKIVWQRDGCDLDISNSEKFFVMREPEGVYKLCIHDPSPLDGGRFIVQASNSVGKEEIRKLVKFLGKDHYKYLPGICHADPKKVNEEETESEEQKTDAQPAKPAEEEDEMDKWGNMKPKKEKKMRLREKVFLPPSKEEIAQESFLLKQVRNHLEFESDLKNQAAKVGSKVKLLCTVSGPSPALSWFKDDEPIEFSPPRVKNTSSGSFGSITFLAVSLADAGVYKCVAANEFVEVSSECTLTVLPTQDPNWIKPTFTRNLKEFYDQKSNDLILEVHVRGYPRPRLNWNKDGLDVEDGDDKYFATRHPDGVYRLNIHDPQIKDSGRYGCCAVNEAGSEDLKYYLKVKPKEEYIHTAGLYHADPTQFAKYKEEEERKRQERLNYRPPPRPKVEEKAPELPKPEEIPEPEPEESEYETTASEYDEEGELIEKPRRKKVKQPPKEPTPPPKEPTPPPKEPTPPREEIQEMAQAEPAKKKERNWMQGAPEGLPEPVKEVVKKPKYQLEFLTKLENRIGVENTGVKLFCQISGPRPEVLWFHNGTPIEKNDENKKNMSNENVAALSILKAKPEDSGEYTCIVKNRECKIETTCTLTILEVPKEPEKGIAPHYPFGMKYSFNSQTDELIIECVIRGTPRLFIKWYKDAKQIENDDKYLMSRDGETYKLFVHKPTFRDSGIYLVQTENTYGMEFLKYVIEFEQKDSPVVSGFIYHADLTKTKKYQEEEERKKQERMAYRPPPLPVPEPVKEEEKPAEEEAAQSEVEEIEEESEYETTESEYDEEGELIEKERRKKVKQPPKEPTPPPKEPTPPPKEPTPPPKEPTPPPKEPTPPPKEPTPPPKEPTPIPEPEPEDPKAKKEIEKPLHVFRAHKITEFRKNAEVPLEIIKRLLSTVAKVGSKIKLSCCVSEGDARIKANWYKNGDPLEIDSRFVANATEDGYISLEIKTLEFDDAGRYKVVIKTKKGEISSECDVNVYGEEEKSVDDVPPILVKAISDTYRPIYNDFVIEVRFRGTPKPKITWIRDGLPIDPWVQYEKYQVKHDEMNQYYTQQLIISNPNQYRDNGKYIIIIENRAGTLELLHMLDFEGRKIEPKRKRMDDVFIVNEVPRVNPKPKSPTPPPVEEKPVEPEVKEEEVVEEEIEEEEEEEDEEED